MVLGSREAQVVAPICPKSLTLIEVLAVGDIVGILPASFFSHLVFLSLAKMWQA
jgi:hypothetical protein